VTISATVAPETRVAYDDANRTLTWEEGDQLLLVGYDNSNTYVGNSTFNYQTGNTFTGNAVNGADSYTAYYKVEGINLNETTGKVTIPYTFYDGQTQSGSGSTAHLKSKLFLGDDTAKPLTQSFTLSGKNSILKLVLSGIPQEVGNLQQLIYKVETGPGMSKSLSLNVTGVTFSDALDTFTAYLSFDPIVTKIAANGEVRITLFGEQPYHWIATITGGKNYTAGNRYTGTVSNGWTEMPLNPLSYITEYNINPAGDDFVMDLTACNVSGYFSYDQAVAQFTTKTIDGVTYHLPSYKEWSGIVPVNGYVRFIDDNPRNNVGENVTVAGTSFSGWSDFRYVSADKVTYALRFKGSGIVSAWRYQYVSDGMNTHMKITSRNVYGQTVIIDEIAQESYWSSNTNNDYVRYFPASGCTGHPSSQSYGYFWSSSPVGSNTAYIMYFHSSTALISGSHIRTSGASVRLFAPGT
jgi:hypothetical protein